MLLKTYGEVDIDFPSVWGVSMLCALKLSAGAGRPMTEQDCTRPGAGRPFIEQDGTGPRVGCLRRLPAVESMKAVREGCDCKQPDAELG